MPRRSVKKDKTAYQLSRERAGLTREAASEKLVFITPSRIEKIESERSAPHPEEVLAMAEAYGDPLLRNEFCTNECPIGRKYIPRLGKKSLSRITLEMSVKLNELVDCRDRLMSITMDDTVTQDEEKDLSGILESLDQMSALIESFKLWAEDAMKRGK